MNQVNVYDAGGTPFDVEELRYKELPPIPQWAIDRINEAGGFTGDKPNVRIVSGLDPAIQEFYGGKWWRTYAFREHVHSEFVIWHRQGKPDKILTPKEAEVIARSKNKEGILTPRLDTRVTEHGVPRYFVELYKPPQYFGEPEAWESIRYDKDENEKWFDLMGEFPHEGRYETWFCIEEAVEENGNIIGTRFKDLDELAVGLIIEKIEEAKNKTMAEKHKEIRHEAYYDTQKAIAEAKDNVREIVREHADRLVGTPKSFVPSKYESSNKSETSKEG